MPSCSGNSTCCKAFGSPAGSAAFQQFEATSAGQRLADARELLEELVPEYAFTALPIFNYSIMFLIIEIEGD